MSIIIKGMEMPKNCVECPIRCLCLFYTGRVDIRNQDCPITEIKEPHGRLGDLDKLMTEFMDSDLDHLQRDDWREVIQIVADAKTVIEAEGRET